MVAARAPVLLSGLVVAPMLARALGPADRGYAAATTAALAMAPVVVALGVPMAVRRRAAWGVDADALRGARLLLPLQVVVGGLIGLALAPLVLPGASARLTAVFVAAMALTMTYIEVLNAQSVLIARKAFGAVATIQMCQPICYAVAVAIGWSAGRLSIGWVISSYALSVVGNVVVGEALVRVGFGGGRIPASALARQGLPFAGAQAAEIASSRIDTLLTVSIIGAHDAGLYAVATMVGSLPVVVAQAVGAAVFADHARRPEAEHAAAATSVVRMAFVVGTVAGVLLGGTAPFLVPLIFGHAFSAAVGPTVILAIAAPATVAVSVSAMLLAAAGKGHRATVVQGVSVGVDVALLYALGPGLGSSGAALASLGSALCAAVVGIRLLQLRLGAVSQFHRADLSAARVLLGGD